MKQRQPTYQCVGSLLDLHNKKVQANALISRALDDAYAHTCPNNSGCLVPVTTRPMETTWATKDDVLEYIVSLIKEKYSDYVFVCYTEPAWFIQDMEYHQEVKDASVAYFSIEKDDWYKDGKLVNFAMDSPFDHITFNHC